MNSFGQFILLGLGVCMFSQGCSHPNPTVDTSTVEQLDLARYTGTWYEIARLPNRFERGLVNVRATYTLLGDGKVRVFNQGVHQNDGEPSEVTGQARRPHAAHQGQLQVSFVPPYFWFYGDYNVLYVSDDYQLAVVSGSDSRLLWFLARQSSISATQKAQLLEIAAKRGFDTAKLLWTPQNVTF